MEKRQGAENAQQKTVRLLKNLNTGLIEEGSPNRLNLQIELDGSGLVLFNQDNCSTEPIFGFDSLDQLTKYLEGSQLVRLIMTGVWAYGRD